MEMVLNSKNKLGFINGFLSKPDVAVDPQVAAKWQRNNDIVSSWILNSVSKDIVSSTIFT